MKLYLLNHSNRHKYLMVICDALIVVAGVLLSYSIRIYLNQGEMTWEMLYGKLHPWHALIVPLHLFALYVFDLYNLDRLVNTVRSSVLIVISVFSAGLIISGIFFFMPKYIFGRQVLLIHLMVLSVMLVVWRLLFLRVFSRTGRKKKIALVCNPETATTFMDHLAGVNFNGIEVAHVCCKQGGEDFEKPGIRTWSSLPALLNDGRFDVLVYDSSRERFSNEEIRLIMETRQRNKGVYEISSLYTNLTGKVPLEMIDGKWIMNSEGLQGSVSKPFIHMKRLFDITAASLLLILFSPVILAVALLIKLESRGNVIFAQERLGRNRKPFMCYKFRTMVENAEQKTGQVWSKKDDPRVTRFGRVLRKTRLDELPQLWNIVKGDISFVGPRPIRAYFADQLSMESPFYELRFSVQPGLSGWAQIHGCYAVPYGLEALKYELFYIQNMSLFLDIIVVFKTIQSFFKLEGK